MRPAWAAKGMPNVFSARGSDAAAVLKAHAEKLGLSIAEMATVTKGSVEVIFARCELK